MRMLVISDRDRSEFIRRINEIKLTGRKFYGEFKLYRVRRSLPQNSLLHMWLSCIEHETGQESDSLKRYFKKKYLPWSIKEIFGDKQIILTPTHTLNTKEFSELLDKIYIEMVDMGIYLPQPGQEGWDNFYLEYGVKR